MARRTLHHRKASSNFLNSPNAPSHKDAGFTLIEILIVTAILVILFGMGLFMSFDFYRSFLIHSERDLLVGVLEKARNRAMNNIGESPHGVHITSSSYILFQGTAYASANPDNEPITSNPAITKAGLTDIVFSQLSGDPDTTGSITLQSSARTDIININDEGAIGW